MVLPDSEHKLDPSNVTFFTLGKLENPMLKSIWILFPSDCWAFHPLFSNEHMFTEHCVFKPSQTVKEVTGNENSITTFQDDTVSGKVM